ncbi:hypothetical protein ATKI12_6572 [Kitasatospora sp. Ki12]
MGESTRRHLGVLHPRDGIDRWRIAVDVFGIQSLGRYVDRSDLRGMVGMISSPQT